MEAIDFFTGTRIQPPLFLSFYDGRAQLVCAISESWGQKFVHSIKCGAKFTRKLKRSVGITYTEKDDLESLVAGSLGLKGIASLDSQISAKSGIELQLYRSEEVEDEFTFDSPKCGERVIALYQFRRIIDLKYRDDRPFRKKEWSMTTTDWVDRIHDNSYVIPEIRECGCKSDSLDSEDGKLYVEMGNVTMTTGFVEFADRLRIPSLDLEIEKSKLHQPIQFHQNKLPDYLRFIAGEIPEIMIARFSFEKTQIKEEITKVKDVSDRIIERLLEQERASTLRQAEFLREKLEEELAISPKSPRAVRVPSSSVESATTPEERLLRSIFGKPLEDKNEFDVVLNDSGPRKIEVIKAIRQLTNLGLSEAKTMAETAGSKVLSEVSREEAIEALRKLKAAGADVDAE
jgi:large subunit ribosomal protein L7/L12